VCFRVEAAGQPCERRYFLLLGQFWPILSFCADRVIAPRYFLGYDQIGQMVDARLGYCVDSLWLDVPTSRDRLRLVRDDDDLGAGEATACVRPGSADRCPGGDAGASAQTLAGEIPNSVGELGGVTTSATSPCCKSKESGAKTPGSSAPWTNGDEESMNDQDSEETASQEQVTQTPDEHDTGDQKQQQSDEDIELSEEGRKEVHDMVEAYEDKPTVVLPGSGGTITGTAINEWLDDDGNPKFGDPEEHPFAHDRDESDSGRSKETSEDGP
jgi:hypothetical protein